MNKPQKHIIFIELIIVGLVIWRYLEDSLTFNSALKIYLIICNLYVWVVLFSREIALIPFLVYF